MPMEYEKQNGGGRDPKALAKFVAAQKGEGMKRGEPEPEGLEVECPECGKKFEVKPE